MTNEIRTERRAVGSSRWRKLQQSISLSWQPILGLQNNTVNANTNVLAIGGGRNSSTAAAAEGSVNNVGNLLVGINSNNA